MPFYDFFRNLFNIPARNGNLNENQNYSNNADTTQDYRNNFWGPNGDRYEEMWRNAHDRNSYRGRDDDDIQNFNVFTDPLEMQRYFEHQINDMLKSFGGFFGSDSDSFFGFSGQLPALAPPESKFSSVDEPSESGSLRDRFLKPGYENKDDSKMPKRDQVLDDRTINPVDLDELLKEKSPTHKEEVTPYQYEYEQKSFLPQIRSFGQSMSSKTIRRPDGTVEIHKTIRDSAGNEENIVTRQMGDKQYTITIRTDKEGRQEKCEDLINMDEADLRKFKDFWNRGNAPQIDGNSTVDDSLNKLFPYFDKFFK